MREQWTRLKDSLITELQIVKDISLEIASFKDPTISRRRASSLENIDKWNSNTSLDTDGPPRSITYDKDVWPPPPRNTSSPKPRRVVRKPKEKNDGTDLIDLFFHEAR